jgi:hypothetical protein
VTTIIVDKRCPQRFAALKGRLDELRRAPWEAAEKLVVDHEWVKECVQVYGCVWMDAWGVMDM